MKNEDSQSSSVEKDFNKHEIITNESNNQTEVVTSEQRDNKENIKTENLTSIVQVHKSLQLPENPFRDSNANNDIILKPENLENENVENWELMTISENIPSSRNFLADANYDTVNVKGTANHIGSKIIASSVTIVHNNPSVISREGKVEEQDKTNKILKYSCIKRKQFIFIIILLVIVITCNIFYQVIITTDKEHIQNEPRKEYAKNETLIPSNYIHPEPFFINRTGWNASSYKNHGICFSRNEILTIVVSQVGSDNCYDINSCSNIIKQLEIEDNTFKESDKNQINYNFLIGGDGRVYEGRGWKCLADEFDAYSNRRISVAFVGNYSCTKPNHEENLLQVLQLQWNSLKTLIEIYTKETTDNNNKKHLILSNYIIMPRCCIYSLTNNINNPGGKLINLMTKDDHFTKVDCFHDFKKKCNDLC
ncbi:uncharacterized protein LOC142319441 [Lycorma delicatula]|uniref:uncharacterized protein LOC142319441 n=1 Tax=Lycorma delicatula TaxID=130591 RepID=UPI003F5135B1